MTQIRVLHLALAGLVAVRSEPIRRTNALLTALSLPARSTDALASPTAGGIVLAVTLLGAVDSVGVQRTLVHAHLPHVARWTLAASGDVVTGGIIQAVTVQLTVGTMTARGTLVGADIARPAGGALTGAILWIAASVVLTATILLTLDTVFAIRAAHIASDIGVLIGALIEGRREWGIGK